MVARTRLFGSDRRYRIFTAVKYLTYTLLSINILLFLQEELRALHYTFTAQMGFAQYVQAFSATIDTAAWVVLLLLFELETSVLDDKQIRGLVRLALHGIRAVCFITIVYAFTGYCAELMTLNDAYALVGFDACGALDEGWSVLQRLDEYLPLAAENCATLGGSPMAISGFQILAAPEVLASTRLMAWVDVVNAGAWILVVIFLEVEVRMQLRGTLSDNLMRALKYLKFLVYGALLIAAVIWWFYGDFLDFWDASMWLFAFIFIELNVFDWQYESQHSKLAPAAAPAG